MSPASLATFLGFWLLAGTCLAADLGGQLLVANRHLRDPHFAHSVIYVLDHTETGAMGLVVNRAAGRAALREVLRQQGVRSASKRSITLFYGGPVEPGRGFLLHSPDYQCASTQFLGTRFALSTGRDILEAIAAGKGPKQARLVLGYAGWGKGQLDQEVARADWLLTSADPALVFSATPAQVWERALRFAGMRL